MRVEEAMPRFANQKLVRKIFGISRPWLESMVIRGEIRSIKNGASKQSTRLYRVADIESAMERMCIGRKPKRFKKKEDNE